MTDYSLLFRPDRYLADKQEHFVDKRLSIQHYQNACVLPYKLVGKAAGGGVITQSGEYLSNTSGHQGTGCGYNPGKCRKSANRAIYLGIFQPTWGHLITDCVRRFWFLQSEEYQKEYRDCMLVYAAYPGFSFIDSFKQLLSIWNIDYGRFVEIKEPTEFCEIIIPDESFYTINGGARYFTAEYRNMIDQVRKYAVDHYTGQGKEKIYYAYSSKKTHGLINRTIGEKRIRRFFQQMGYTVVFPEKLTFFEQLNVLINTSDFATTVGSCSHNSMFLRDGTNVTFIPRANYLTGYQQAIDEIHDLNIRYVDSSMSIYTQDSSPWSGPFFFFISRNLCKAFGQDIRQTERKSNYSGFRRYQKQALLLKDKIECRKVFEYYSDEYLHYLFLKYRWSLLYLIRTLAKKAKKRINHSKQTA